MINHNLDEPLIVSNLLSLTYDKSSRILTFFLGHNMRAISLYNIFIVKTFKYSDEFECTFYNVTGQKITEIKISPIAYNSDIQKLAKINQFFSDALKHARQNQGVIHEL